MKLCCVFNFAAHYRSSIYHLIDNEMQADFYIGDFAGNLKKMDYQSLKGYKNTLRNIKLLASFTWQSGVVSLAFRPYKNYLVTGDFSCISTWVLLFLCRLLNKKTYLWTHGWYGREGLGKRLIKRLFFKLSTGVFLYGEYAKDLMIKEGFRADKLFVIANSLDYDKQLQVRKNLRYTSVYQEHFQNNNPNLIFVGRLTKVKRIDMILDAMDILQQSGVLVNLTLIGGEIEGFDVKREISQRGLEKRVWLYGPCYDEKEIGELFYNATVCVSPGNVGLTAIHAFSFGCPVITHNDFTKQMPEFEVIQDKINGTFFEYGNTKDLARVINWWIYSYADKSDEIHTNCYKIIDDKFNPYYQIQLFKKVINHNI